MNRLDSWDPVAMTFAIRTLDSSPSTQQDVDIFRELKQSSAGPKRPTRSKKTKNKSQLKGPVESKRSV